MWNHFKWKVLNRLRIVNVHRIWWIQKWAILDLGKQNPLLLGASSLIKWNSPNFSIVYKWYNKDIILFLKVKLIKESLKNTPFNGDAFSINKKFLTPFTNVKPINYRSITISPKIANKINTLLMLRKRKLWEILKNITL